MDQGPVICFLVCHVAGCLQFVGMIFPVLVKTTLKRVDVYFTKIT